MTPDFPTAPPAYGLEGPSAGRTVEKSQPASHTEFLTLPYAEDRESAPLSPIGSPGHVATVGGHSF